jgi:uncharacterized protein (DUF2225 family)
MSKELMCPECNKWIDKVVYENMKSTFIEVTLEGELIEKENDPDLVTLIRCPKCMYIIYDSNIDRKKLYETLAEELGE